MKKSLGSFVALNRKPLLLFGVVLVLTVFGFINWQAGAQINRRGQQIVENKAGSTDRPDLAGLSEFKRNRILADEAASDYTGVAASDSAPAVEPTAIPETPDGFSCSANTVIYAYNFTNDHLVSFSSSAPGTFLTDITLPGLDTANNEVLEFIHFRTADGKLYGVANNLTTGLSRVVKIEPSTGVVTSVSPGTTFAAAASLFYAGDINPLADTEIRETGDVPTNRRISRINGTVLFT